MAIHAALAWPSNRKTKGLIVDLSALTYNSGDSLLSWRHNQHIRNHVGDRIRVVVSVRNRKAVEGLLRDEEDEPFMAKLTLSIDECLREMQ